MNIENIGWRPAQLKDPAYDITCRSSRRACHPTPGEYIVSVRATGGSCVLQATESLPPGAAGASGWHTLRLHVEWYSAGRLSGALGMAQWSARDSAEFRRCVFAATAGATGCRPYD
jgi:hypothetical protein